VVASIVCLDDGEDLRMIFSQLAENKCGMKCLALASVKELLERSDEVLKSKLVFLDINLKPGEPSGIDAYNWLVENNYAGKIFFLTGHGHSHPLVSKAEKSGIEVLEKPVAAEKICALILDAASVKEKAIK
jgi:FixJ family two-component response regulator